MRLAPTGSEQLLWQAIRGRRLGVQFRRQVPLGGRYIADFFGWRYPPPSEKNPLSLIRNHIAALRA
jgi:hypothetical protein